MALSLGSFLFIQHHSVPDEYLLNTLLRMKPINS